MLPETTPDEIHDRSGHKARFLQDRDQTMKPKQFCIRAAACLFPLSLILMCIVTPIVVPAQDDPAANTAAAPAAEPADQPGVVRISDVAELPAEVAEEVPDGFPVELYETPKLTPVTDTGSAIDSGIELDFDDDAGQSGIELDFDDDAGQVTLSDVWHEHSVEFLSRNREQSEALANWMFDRMGLYTPAVVHTAPVGSYNMIYPVNPDYVNPRDLRVYGAQGAGVPIVVPLAPTVRSSYNYSSGLPASRLTPISVPR